MADGAFPTTINGKVILRQSYYDPRGRSGKVASRMLVLVDPVRNRQSRHLSFIGVGRGRNKALYPPEMENISSN